MLFYFIYYNTKTYNFLWILLFYHKKMHTNNNSSTHKKTNQANNQKETISINLENLTYVRFLCCIWILNNFYSIQISYFKKHIQNHCHCVFCHFHVLSYTLLKSAQGKKQSELLSMHQTERGLQLRDS